MKTVTGMIPRGCSPMVYLINRDTHYKISKFCFSLLPSISHLAEQSYHADFGATHQRPAGPHGHSLRVC